LSLFSSLRAGIIPMRRLVRRLGLDVQRRQPLLTDLLRNHGVGTVLDVGANVGQYGERLRKWGYRGWIVSFEPLREACEALRRRAAADGRWDVRAFALGDQDGTATLNVSEMPVFSSILPGKPELYSTFANARAVRTDAIAVHRLDSIFDALPRADGAVFLKIDTQGYEGPVIEGAAASLRSIEGVQVELSVAPLYEGESKLLDMVRLLEDRGFGIELIEPAVFDPSSLALLQVDCTFFRRRAA
jgi:FkbM family methyltransferase